ncbi:hypothetical protein ACEQ8H_008291 [Pleosporales sp. CAS-2024a]
MSPMARFCLGPVLAKFEHRIAARGPVTMEWQLTSTPSARIVSHRASMLGDSQPDCAFRQAIVRIESTQKLTVKHLDAKNPARLPSNVEGAGAGSPKDNIISRNVVEYLVLQIRVTNGREGEWKIWGFAQESTPARVKEDEAHWKKTVDSHAAAL